MKTEVTSIGRIADLSLSGCMIHAARNLFCEYQRVEVSFDVNQIFIRIQGFIRNIRADNALGIEFTDISERTKQRLKEMIEELEEMRKKTTPEKLKESGS